MSVFILFLQVVDLKTNVLILQSIVHVCVFLVLLICINCKRKLIIITKSKLTFSNNLAVKSGMFAGNRNALSFVLDTN